MTGANTPVDGLAAGRPAWPATRSAGSISSRPTPPRVSMGVKTAPGRRALQDKRTTRRAVAAGLGATTAAVAKDFPRAHGPRFELRG